MAKYNDPLVLGRADPYVYKHTDGTYYFTATYPAYDRICIRKSATINGITAAEEKVIWRKHDEGVMASHIWAPEIHYIDGKWYIYFAAGESKKIWEIRPYVLECTGPDPMNDPWIELGMMQAHRSPSGRRKNGYDSYSFTEFSLDATTFEHRGKRYFIWAEKVHRRFGISNLYIAEMESPNKLKTVQVLLTTPDYDWERIDFWVCEGPAVLKYNGKIFVTYSASATGQMYCMGMLSADEDADLLDPHSWTKKRYPVLKTDPEKKVFGPGHNCFTTGDDGEVLCILHYRDYSDKYISGDPLNNPDRHAHVLEVQFENGEPVFKL